MRVLPAYPLFIKDPYFSVWSDSDILTEKETVFWTGKARGTYGIVNVDGKTYNFLGKIDGVEPLCQTGVKVTTFRTIYSFTCDDFDLEVAFFSPLPIDDYEILSCPVCYFEYKINPKKPLKNVTISLSLREDWCYNDMGNTEMRGDVFACENMDVAYFGLNRQHIFNKTSDRFGADWGYYYLAADSCYYHSISDFTNITECDNGKDLETTKYITGQNLLGDIQESTSGKMLVAFDDIVSINYYGEMLRGYYFSDGKNIMDALQFSLSDYARVCDVCARIEKDIEKQAKPYGEKYESILNASYRQVIAAHKLVKDAKGRILFLSKECGSCGCIATVDVTYPTMPMLALYNPELLRGSLQPIFDFAKMPVWEYDFAPHDAGMYPFCNGQYYGVLNKTEGKYGRAIDYYNGLTNGKDVLPMYYLYPAGSHIYNYARQMPVEECGNMILCSAMYLACGGDKEWIKENLPTLTKWCDYLVDKGLIPENQLCTDDFLSHMDKNINLAIKSVVGIGGFAKLLSMLGLEGGKYETIAKERAKQIIERFKGTHMPLSFDSDENTFSMKYNLAPAKLLGLDLFPQEVLEREVSHCIEKSFAYGIPLDNRSKMSKTDWTMWMAALTDEQEKRDKIMDLVYNVLVSSPDRVPFSDWIVDCETGNYREFVNRTVQGSMFILLLKDKLLGK